MKKILFVGTFQSKIHQTKDVSESIALHLQQEGIATNLTSFHSNKILRLFDILFQIFFYSGDYIHINTFSDQAFMIAEWGSWVAKIRSKKIFLSLHGGKLNEFEKTNPNRVNMVLNRADRILTPSLFLQSYFKEKGFKVDYIPNPLTLEKFPFKLGRYIDNNYKILWVRAFGEIYQPDLAIQTLYEIKKKIPFATLTMIGPDKGLMKESKLLVDSLGLTKDVQFIGPVQNDSLFNYYQSHHCYLNTPKYESFGVALMEAASCGIPIVSLGVGEITYLWKHESTMRIVFEHEAEKLASEIAVLADNSVLADSQALNAKNIAEQFEWKHLRSKWLDLIQ